MNIVMKLEQIIKSHKYITLPLFSNLADEVEEEKDLA